MSFGEERIGKFELEIPSIEDPKMRAYLYNLFSYLIVLRAEALIYKDAIEYVAISPLFEVRRPGEIISEYNILIDQGQIHAIKKDRQKPVRLMTFDPALES